MKLRVYSRLTLSEAEVHAIIPTADVQPPVEREQLRRDIREGVHVVVIIDGKFYQNSAVPPSEVLDALRAGVRVYGASSMGALRAVELEAYGMTGIGRVFERVRRERHGFRDDFLGQAFAEESNQPLSLPWIDLACNLDELVAVGRLSAPDAERIAAVFAELHFSERAWGALRQRLQRCDGHLLPWASTAYHEMGSQKRRDAVAALECARDELRAIALRNAAITHRRRSLKLSVSAG